VGGEGSGLTQLQVDQTNSHLQTARITLLNSQISYRNQLDQFKMQMGLPPDTPIVPAIELISLTAISNVNCEPGRYARTVSWPSWT